MSVALNVYRVATALFLLGSVSILPFRPDLWYLLPVAAIYYCTEVLMRLAPVLSPSERVWITKAMTKVLAAGVMIEIVLCYF